MNLYRYEDDFVGPHGHGKRFVGTFPSCDAILEFIRDRQPHAQAFAVIVTHGGELDKTLWIVEATP